MKIAIFSVKSFEKPFLDAANQSDKYELVYFETSLNEQTACLAKNYPVISCFVTDHLNADVLKMLAQNGVKLIALRCAGYNHVDVAAAKQLNISIVRVPAYSPYSVAEFAAGLILTLNRKIHKAYSLVREHNFLLSGLMGFDLHGKTVGIIGTGNIGTVFAKIMLGFGCRVIASDPILNDECKKLGVEYMTIDQLLTQADIISLHCPLNPQTHHIINESAIAKMKKGVMLINTGRGGLIDTSAVIQGLKSDKIGYLGLDVYEEEEGLFFKDLSDTIIKDETFTRLQTFPNVVITGHQAFFTHEAMVNIAETTLTNIAAFEKNPSQLINVVI